MSVWKQTLLYIAGKHEKWNKSYGRELGNIQPTYTSTYLLIQKTAQGKVCTKLFTSALFVTTNIRNSQNAKVQAIQQSFTQVKKNDDTL